MAGRAKSMRRSGERFMAGPGAETELSAGVESQSVAPFESAAQPDQPMAGMGSAPRMMSGGYGGAYRPAATPATASAASAYAMESVTGSVSLRPPPLHAACSLAANPETPQLEKELERESVSEIQVRRDWNPLLVADENGQIRSTNARPR